MLKLLNFTLSTLYSQIYSHSFNKMKSIFNIKEIRQLHNFTQQEFADALGITRELVNKMEKGKSGISKATSALVKQFLLERKSENNSQGNDEVEFFGVPRKPGVPYHL